MGPPPNYVAYGDPDFRGFASLQNVGGPARAIGILMMIIIPLDAASVLVGFGVRSKARNFLDGVITESAFKRSFGLSVIISSLTSLAMLAAFVLTIVWMFRMAKNQQAMGRIGTWVPGWAIGGWFLPPCVLYVIPYLMMRDLWKSSDPNPSPEWKKNPVAPIVTIWWVLYGLLPILFITVTFGTSNIRGQTTLNAAKNLNDTFAASTVSAIVQIAAGVAYLMLVRQLTSRHKLTIHET